jgi:hypothetical protein
MVALRRQSIADLAGVCQNHGRPWFCMPYRHWRQMVTTARNNARHRRIRSHGGFSAGGNML